MKPKQSTSGVNVLKRFQIVCQSPCRKDEEYWPDNKTCICVCEAVTPALRYCQLFGISPISLHDSYNKEEINQNKKYSKKIEVKGSSRHFHQSRVTNSELKPETKDRIPEVTFTKGKSSKCYIEFHWKSFPLFINLLLIFSFAPVTIWVFFKISTVLKVYFFGTDLYTFGTQTICLYSQCNLILINSLFQREKLCEIWELLIKVLKDLTQGPSKNQWNESDTPAYQQNLDKLSNHNFLKCEDMLQSHLVSCLDIEIKLGEQRKSKLCWRLCCLRIFSFCTVAIAVTLSICHTISFINLVFHGCFEKSTDLNNGTRVGVGDVVSGGTPPCPFGNFFLFLQKFFYGMIDFVQQGVPILFGNLCLVIYIFFEEIEDQLEIILKDGNDMRSVGVERQHLVENLRIAHENLSRCCRLISRCLGLPVLVVSISSVVSITCALYSFTLYSGAIAREESVNIARYYVIWAFHGWFASFCLVLILLPGQMVTNASEGPSHVIGRCVLANLDRETKYQLSQFQQQSCQRVVITACNVVNIGLGFIAAAATNVTTYMLVILQFRLGVEK